LHGQAQRRSILGKRRAGVLSRGIDIHSSSHGQLVEQPRGDGISALRVGQRDENGIIAGLALLRAVQRGQPDIELAAAFLKAEACVVGDVIAAPHERIDRA